MTGNDVQLTEDQLREIIEGLKKELEEKTTLAQDRLDRLKYLQADFDNYRKRFEKEKESIINLASENLIKELLVILDDFERALPSIENEKNKEGINMLYKNFLKILAEHGLQPIESIGKKFDPNFHEVQCNEKSDKENGIILEDLEKGYLLKSKVIRPSKVKIAENITGDEGENNG